VIADRSEELAERVKLAADWFVRSQLRMAKPYWDANHGRFPYNRHRPTGKTVWGLNWTQARGIMVLIAADRLAPAERYMESARLAAEYIEILQILDQRCAAHFGAIREEVPQSRRYNIRDQTEAASALLYLGAYIGEDQLVDRARIWADWYLREAVDEATGWPRAFRQSDGSWTGGDDYFLIAIGNFMRQLGRYVGDMRYVEQGHLANARYALRHVFTDAGTLRIDPAWRQHATESGLVVNEDGALIALMAAEQETSEARFRDAALRHLERVLEIPLPLPLYSGLPNTMLVAAEAARLYDHAPSRAYIERNLAALLDAQITAEEDPERGAFVGEDENPAWYSGGQGSDYLTTRATAYGALALARIEGTVATGGYSASAELPKRKTAYVRADDSQTRRPDG